MASSKQGVAPISNAIRGLDFFGNGRCASSSEEEVDGLGGFLSSKTMLVPIPALDHEERMFQWVEDGMFS